VRFLQLNVFALRQPRDGAAFLTSVVPVIAPSSVM
jgi:hypothetical protein